MILCVQAAKIFAMKDLVFVRDQFDSFGCSGVAESSFKIFSDGFRDNRFVIGINAKDIDHFRLEQALRLFNPAFEVAAEVIECFPSVTTFGFGLDGFWLDGVRRLYLEYWGNLEEIEPKLPAKPCYVMDAWKWQVCSPESWYRSRYWVMPGCQPDRCCTRFIEYAEEIFESQKMIRGLRAFMDLIQGEIISENAIQLWFTRDMNQAGELTPRQTLDLNIVDCDVSVSKINSLLEGLAAEFPRTARGLNDWISRYPPAATISHLAIGIDQSSRKYACVYVLN